MVRTPKFLTFPSKNLSIKRAKLYTDSAWIDKGRWTQATIVMSAFMGVNHKIKHNGRSKVDRPSNRKYFDSNQ